MERLINTLRRRLMSVVLVIHAALVPLLYLGVTAIVTDGYAELFVNPARSYSQLAADELERGAPDDFERHAAELLDSVLLTGQVVFAEIVDGNRRITARCHRRSHRQTHPMTSSSGPMGTSLLHLAHHQAS